MCTSSLNLDNNTKFLSVGFITITLLTIMYQDGLQELSGRWAIQKEYSHAYFLPVLSLFFIWHHRNEIKKQCFVSDDWSGFVLLATGVLIYLIGKISIMYSFVHISFVIVLIALAWTLIGLQGLKLILVPLLLLFFMIPMPYFVEALLSAKLQLISSKIGVEIIRWCNIPVYLEGNVIDLGFFKLQVVEACSGLRYLFPLMSVGFLCAYLFHAPLWKRTLLFFSTIPITVFMNSLRIGIIGILVKYQGVEVAQGFIHDFEGWIVFMACFGILVIEMIVFNYFSEQKKPFIDVFGLHDVGTTEISNNSTKFKGSKKLPRPFVTSLVFVGITAIFVILAVDRKETIPNRQSFYSFPLQLSDWQGSRNWLSEEELNILQLTDYALVDYKNLQDKKIVNFYVAYYESQKQNVMPHSPRVCIPGGGWKIADINRVLIHDIPINRLLIKKAQHKQLVYYWYQLADQVFADELKLKLSLLKNSIVHNRSDGALIRLVTYINPGESLASADLRLKSFMTEMKPVVSQFLPI